MGVRLLAAPEDAEDQLVEGHVDVGAKVADLPRGAEVFGLLQVLFEGCERLLAAQGVTGLLVAAEAKAVGGVALAGYVAIVGAYQDDAGAGDSGNVALFGCTPPTAQ